MVWRERNKAVSEEPITSMERARRSLRSTVIEPFKQIRFGLYVIGISVAFVAVCALMFMTAFIDQYKHVMNIFHVVDPNLQWELVTNEVFLINAIRIGLMFAVFIAVMFTVVFRLTHRYYGPLVSIERFVDQVLAGDYHVRCKIREKDELHALCDKLNAMAEALESRHGYGEGHTYTVEEAAAGKRHGKVS